MPVNYDYRIGPLEWDESDPTEPHWRAPVGTVGMTDLDRESDHAAPGSDRAMCVFAVPAGTPVSELTWPLLATGDMREINATAGMRSTWQSQTGFMPQGDKLLDLIWDHLTRGSDPDWGTACKPLIPTTQGRLELHFGGHSLVKQESFRFGVHGHTAKVEALLQRDFRRTFEDADQQRIPIDHHLRVLDYWCEKYRLDKTDRGRWERLIPPDLRRHVSGPQPHQTTVSDNFNRADESLDAGNWTEVSGDINIVSNEAVWAGSTNNAAARYNTALSSADHYGEAKRTDGLGGVGAYAVGIARFASSDTTYYAALWRDSPTNSFLYKRVTGTFTKLTAALTVTGAANTYQTRCNGSTISGYLNGALDNEQTDTSITSNLYVGVGLRESGNKADDFVGADLAAGGGATPKGVFGLPISGPFRRAVYQ